MTRRRADTTYKAIRERILSGHYRPAQHLVESQVAESLGVGRHAVRLALERLAAENLVTISPNKGAVVRSLTVEEVLDTLVAREVLEGAAARLAATGDVTDTDIKDLARCLEEMENALDSRAFDDYSRANVRFHQIIHRACGNHTIPKLIKSLQGPVIRLQFRTILLPGRGESSLSEHRDIYDALVRRDGEKAEAAMRAHIQRLRRTIAAAWELIGT